MPRPKNPRPRPRRGGAACPREDVTDIDVSLFCEKADDDSNNSNNMDILTGEYGSASGDESKYSNKRSKYSNSKMYNSKWESDPILKTWISRYPEDNGKVNCRYCRTVIRAHKNDLWAHTRTLKHQRNFQRNTNAQVFNSFVMELNDRLRKEATKQNIPKRKSVGSNSNSTSTASNSGSDTTTSTFSNDLEPTVHKNHVSSSQGNQPLYNIQDVINDLQNGRFNMMDLCSLLKATTAAIEDLQQRSTEPRLDFLASARGIFALLAKKQ